VDREVVDAPTAPSSSTDQIDFEEMAVHQSAAEIDAWYERHGSARRAEKQAHRRIAGGRGRGGARYSASFPDTFPHATPPS
jgi:hypothetical protein